MEINVVKEFIKLLKIVCIAWLLNSRVFLLYFILGIKGRDLLLHVEDSI